MTLKDELKKIIPEEKGLYENATDAENLWRDGWNAAIKKTKENIESLGDWVRVEEMVAAIEELQEKLMEVPDGEIGFWARTQINEEIKTLIASLSRGENK